MNHTPIKLQEKNRWWSASPPGGSPKHTGYAAPIEMEIRRPRPAPIKSYKIRDFSSWSCFQYMTLHTCRRSLQMRWWHWAKSLTSTVSTPLLLSLSSLEGAIRFMVSPWASVGELAGNREHNKDGSGDFITLLRVLMGGYDDRDMTPANGR